jgi:hypothetical protein
MSITIKTRLDATIYRSCGGGETRVHYEWATGPRNLLRAAETLRIHRKKMEVGYGNIGCGRSWLEIDGVEIDDLDLGHLDYPEEETWAMPRQTRTQKASELIAQVRSGEYAKIQLDVDVRAYLDQMAAAGA